MTEHGKQHANQTFTTCPLFGRSIGGTKAVFSAPHSWRGIPVGPGRSPEQSAELRSWHSVIVSRFCCSFVAVDQCVAIKAGFYSNWIEYLHCSTKARKYQFWFIFHLVLNCWFSFLIELNIVNGTFWVVFGSTHFYGITWIGMSPVVLDNTTFESEWSKLTSVLNRNWIGWRKAHTKLGRSWAEFLSKWARVSRSRSRSLKHLSQSLAWF